MKTKTSRRKWIAIAACVGVLSGWSPCRAQQTDPTLTATVLAQTAELKSIHSKRKKTQEKIIAAETAVTLALDRVHRVEDKMLEYLSNAQGAMQNLYQVKRAAELVLTEIPQNCALLTKSVGGNLKGTAIAAIVSDELTDAATQMASLYPFMVRTLSWNDLWFSLDPEGWATVMSGKNIIGGIVADWNRGYLTHW